MPIQRINFTSSLLPNQQTQSVKGIENKQVDAPQPPTENEVTKPEYTVRNWSIGLGAAATLISLGVAGRKGYLGDGLQKFLGGAEKEASHVVDDISESTSRLKPNTQTTNEAAETLTETSARETIAEPITIEPHPTPKVDTGEPLKPEVKSVEEAPVTKSLFEKFTDILLYPINKSKENKLKKAAEKAAEQARLRAEMLEREKKFEQDLKQAANDLLSEWRTSNKGKFEKKICEDNTGDIIFFTPKDAWSPKEYKVPPQKGEYTLENFAQNDEYMPDCGASTAYLKHNGLYISHFSAEGCYGQTWRTFNDNRWHMHYNWASPKLYDGKLPNSARLPRPVTCLSCGYPGPLLERHPGAVFTVEGHIPLEDMKNIKKNLVEKGIWENYVKVMKSNPTQEERQDARLAVYNEILKYLNK